MDELAKLFDRYSLNARVKPAFLIFFPIVLMVFVLFEPSRTFGGTVVAFLISFGVIAFAANQMSTRGNILQEKLFRKWGAAPTIIILRHSDSRIDMYTKRRYQERLRALIPNFTVVTEQEERANPCLADQMYSSAASYLRERTRDVKKYPLIFSENVEYGFSRNLLACKSFGVFASAFALIVSVVIIWRHFPATQAAISLKGFESVPHHYYALAGGQLFIVVAWLFLVTEKWVEVRAFAYAKRLYSACEEIS